MDREDASCRKPRTAEELFLIVSRENRNMNHVQRDCAFEVMSQYDLSLSEQDEAWAELDKRAQIAPFRAYSAAHAVCADLVNARTRAPSP